MGTLAEPTTLLAAWEAAAAAPAAARAALLVHRAGLTPDLDTALDLDVGECAERALQAHLVAFGPDMDGVLGCPACGELIEVRLHLPEHAAPGAGASAEAKVGALVVRPPTTRDLLAVSGAADARDALVARCVRKDDGTAVVPEALTPAEVTAVEEAAERLAGSAALTVAMRCAACGTDVEAALDLGLVLWDRVDAAAPVLLADVAQLARVYGWSEAAVLRMSPERRRAYLALAQR